MSNHKLRLTDGFAVQIDQLDQTLVYAGLLEGVPTVENNEAIIDAMRKAACERDSAEPLLVQPEMRMIELRRPYPFGEPASIPPVGCVARLRSRIDGETVGLLTVIWFQDEYALPIAPAVIEQIGKEWEERVRVERL